MRHVATGGFVGLLMAMLVSGCAEPGATVEEAEAFVAEAEARLLELWIEKERAAWVQSNFITYDTTAIAADAQTAVIAATMELASEAARFGEVALPEELQRKLLLLKTSMGLAAPADPALQAELAEITTSMESAYGTGVYCPGDGEDCLGLPQMERMVAESRDTDELLDLWTGWRSISPPRSVDCRREGFAIVRAATPGWQGATREHTGSIRPRSNAARRSVPAGGW